MSSSERPVPLPTGSVVRRRTAAQESSAAGRSWWDDAAAEYQSEHGDFLAGFVWGPEGLREEQAGLLGQLSPAAGPVLEVGCGAAQCSAWLATRGLTPVGVDVSLAQLRHCAPPLPLVQADAEALPFRDGAFAAAFSSYGALPFLAHADVALAEVARVLKPGGRWVFSVTHPIRWAFPDDPGPAGLTVSSPYFDRTPYVEQDEQGVATYVEHHRTMGDWIRLLTGSGFRLLDLVEPEWPAENEEVWGGWSGLRGRLLPGTAIFVSELA